VSLAASYKINAASRGVSDEAVLAGKRHVRYG
jgi:hypothetical protein